MQLEFTPDELAFRDEVRSFIADKYPALVRAKQDAGIELAKDDFLLWHRIVAQQGWSVAAHRARGGHRTRTRARASVFAAVAATAAAFARTKGLGTTSRPRRCDPEKKKEGRSLPGLPALGSSDQR